MNNKIKIMAGLACVFALTSCGRNTNSSEDNYGSSAHTSSSVHTHVWETISDTATCEEDGIITKQCETCGEIMKRNSPATGHDYDGNDVCKKCNKYLYRITMEQEEETTSGRALYAAFATRNDYVVATIGINITFIYGNQLWISWSLFGDKGKMTIFDWDRKAFCEIQLRLCEKSLLDKNSQYTFLIKDIGTI